VAALGEHYAAGRLTLEEHDERTSRAFAARVEADLWRLFRDLPAVQPPPPTRPSRPRRESRSRTGLALVLLVVIGLVVLTRLPVPLLLVVGWLWWGRTFRAWSRGQSSGSRRAVRGTWS
jgi:hypothetical protein